MTLRTQFVLRESIVARDTLLQKSAIVCLKPRFSRYEIPLRISAGISP
jgi:hypothetical protein